MSTHPETQPIRWRYMIGADKRLLRHIRKSFAQHAYQALPHATTRTDLLMKKEDDRIGITILDSRAKIRVGSLIEQVRATSTEVQHYHGIRTLFITAFVLFEAEIISAIKEGISIVHVEGLVDLIEVLGNEKIPATGLQADRLLLASQMCGMCRRFSKDCELDGSLEGAIFWRKKHLTLSPQSTEPHWALANLQLRAGRLTEAEEAATRLVQLDPLLLPVLRHIQQRKAAAASSNTALP